MDPHYAGSGIDEPEQPNGGACSGPAVVPAMILLPVALVAIVAIAAIYFRTA